MICTNLGVNRKGHLTFGGYDVCPLAAEYGTPLYLMDEQRIKDNCRMYKNAMKKVFGGNSGVLYAGKAACFRKIYTIMKAEGLGIDVVSSGEIYTAVKAGYPLENAYFHGNNKTDADIAYAMESGVGFFVVDNREELDGIYWEAERRGIVQKVLLRLTPGIDPHTYEAVSTGKVDSKFGTAVATGQAEELAAYALTLKEHVELQGFHCHVGSMVFGEDVYQRAGVVMLEFCALMQEKYGFSAKKLDLGGGYGVRYTQSDPEIDIPANIEALANSLKKKAAELSIVLPDILLEPGRSIVADAGMTVYSVGSVKEIPGYKNYVSVDGGMTDNLRYALYGSHYTVLLANRADEKPDFPCDVVGRCCESGDILQPKVLLPRPVRDDILAVCTTGAYNYSMASNYNRVPRPAVVLLGEDGPVVAVRRETPEDLTANDL